jgi:hypothetical protein
MVLIRESEMGKIAVVRGFRVYLLMFRRFPVRACQEVFGCALIFAALAALVLLAGVAP